MVYKISDKMAEAKLAFTSKGSLKEYLQTPGHQADGEISTYNDDLLPTPPGKLHVLILELYLTLDLEQRTWTAVHYFSFYMTTTFSPSSYNLGATLVSIGLLWWHGLIAAVIGSIILTVVLV
jgi:NCS1 family nucleobase:cation symporter-1